MYSYSSQGRGTAGSASLNGRVEFRDNDGWFGVIDPSPLLPKHNDLFGLLFGVANFAGFQPLFANRGLPSDCDDALRAIYEATPDEYFGASWASYAELISIDWTREAEELDERIHKFAVEPDGTEHYVGKSLADSLPGLVRRGVEEAGSYEERGWRYRSCRITRQDAKEGTEMDLLVRLMTTLADRFGSGNVRLVVFFD